MRDAKLVSHRLMVVVQQLLDVKHAIADWNKLTGKPFNLGTVHVPESIKRHLSYLQHHAMKHATYPSGDLDMRMVKYLSRRAGVSIEIVKCTKEQGAARIQIGLGVLNVVWFNDHLENKNE